MGRPLSPFVSEFPEEFEQTVGAFDASSKADLYERFAEWQEHEKQALPSMKGNSMAEAIGVILILLWLLVLIEVARIVWRG